jgi:hypothetical protein
MPPISPQQPSDFLLQDDLDLLDETELRRLVSEVDAFAGNGKGLRVSALTFEQWQTLLMRRLPPSMRRGQHDYIYVLPDRNDPQHLLFSPGAVQGINEGSRPMQHAVISAAVRAIPTPLKGPLRKGINEIVLEACGERLGMELFGRTYPQESQFVRALLRILVAEYGYRESEWALEMRRNPERCLFALRKTKFAPTWASYIRQDPALAEELKAAPNKRKYLTDKLLDPGFSLTSPFGKLTAAAAVAYLESLEQERQDGPR